MHPFDELCLWPCKPFTAGGWHRLCFDRIAVDRSLVGTDPALFGLGSVAEGIVFVFLPALVGPLKSSVWRSLFWLFELVEDASRERLDASVLWRPWHPSAVVFFFSDLVALVDDLLVPLGIGRKGPMVPLDGGIGQHHR